MTRPVRLSAGASGPAWARALPYGARRIWAPDVYQGGSRRTDYFEGWYIKCVDAACEHPIALIPGVSHDDAGGTSHAFVQVVRPGGDTTYVDYPVESFTFDRETFSVTVGPNRFSSSGVVLDIERDGCRLRGELSFEPWTPWPVSAITPGIMGWYRFVPRMECYHAVCSLGHSVSGSLVLDGSEVRYDGGRGYAEKDWGRSFPSSWVWAQSNHFEDPGTCVTLSVARIPWMGGAFVGFIAGVLVGGELYRFTTYTGARLTSFESGAGAARMTLEDADHVLAVEVESANPAPLRAPVHGRMVARADEALDAQLVAKLTRRRDGAVLLDGIGLRAGVEVMDERGELAAGVSPAPRR